MDLKSFNNQESENCLVSAKLGYGQVEAWGWEEEVGQDWKIENIVSTTDSLGEIMFIIKWKGSDEADLVPAKKASIKIP